MIGDSIPVDVSRRITDNERRTVKDYVLSCQDYSGKYFRHNSLNPKSNGKVYCVDKVRFRKEKRGLHPFILTQKGNNLDSDKCLNDTEIDLGDFIKSQNNQI